MGRDKGFSDPGPSLRNKWKLRCYRKGKQRRGQVRIADGAFGSGQWSDPSVSQLWGNGAHSFSGCNTAVVKTTLFAWSVVGPARVDSTRLVFVLFIKMFSEC